ncbi:hypothetical protein VCR9J2_10080 [Vibrio crassostreae]|nr:hypothetical protein VCR9J2_10080 [Vibrio crassostreae]
MSVNTLKATAQWLAYLSAVYEKLWRMPVNNASQADLWEW